MKRVIKIFILLPLLLLNLSSVQASNMRFIGTLIEPPPCKINDGKNIEIPFDKVGVNTVDGINHRRPIDYVLNCIATSTWSMNLIITGPKAEFDTERATLQTSAPDLGIQIYQNGKPFVLDKPIKIDPQAPPILEAVLVKKPGSTLKKAPFSVTATLRAEYY